MSAREGLKAVMNEPANKPVIRKLLITTVAMIVFPIAVFFGFREYVGRAMDMDVGGRNLWAGISAAVTVNVIMIYYVVLAWNETLEDQAVEKKDK